VICIFVVDDHPIVLQGLVAVLEDQADFHVVGTAASAEAALAEVARTGADIVLLDLELGEMGGVAAMPRIIEAAPRARIVVFTAYDTDECVVGAVRAGARGYLLKGAPVDEIARAIRAVHAGGTHLEPHVATKLLAQIGRAQPIRPRLTEREREVLRLVATGLPNKQIAHALGIAERTVKYHVASLFDKLGADNRAQAVALAAQQGLLT